MSSVTRTWSVPTSPRNPYKLCDELGLLKKYEGEIWNKETQIKFAIELSRADFYEGSIYEREPDFSARDRVNRSPKTFGFIRLDADRKIKITEAGNQIIKKQGLEDLFLRQLLKWQYPSPNHNGVDYQAFHIKPFLEMLRLIRELGGISKKEIAIFGVSLIDYRDYERAKKDILAFRSQLEKTKGKRNRQELELKTHLEFFQKVYSKEIGSGDVSIRQGGNNNVDVKEFLKTKIRNSKDYADAALRYFRATGLFSLSSRNYRLKIVDTKLEIVDAILAHTGRDPEPYIDRNQFLDYLGDNALPKLPDDDERVLRNYLANLIVRLGWDKNDIPFIGSIQELQRMDCFSLKDLKTKLEGLEQSSVLKKQISDLQSYEQFDDIVEIFEKIGDRKDIDIPDKPLFFEWNVWRSMAMLDDGDVQANFKFDIEGKPYSGAPAKIPDVVCEYKDFVLVVEVTMMSGNKQYEAEGEPVARHVADTRKKLMNKGDKRAVYGLFIAPVLNEATVAHFFVLKKTNIAYYGGSVDIIPLKLQDFLTLLKKAKVNGGVTSKNVFQFIDDASREAEVSNNEKDWQDKIGRVIASWVS